MNVRTSKKRRCGAMRDSSTNTTRAFCPPDRSLSVAVRRAREKEGDAAMVD